MNTRAGLVALVVIIVIGATALIIMPPKANAPSTMPPDGTPSTTTSEPSIKKASIPDLITVDIPTIGSEVASPVMIVGSARGTWYFEASFPIEVKNEVGTVIGQGHGEAQSEWMTEDFVQFTAQVIFQPQPTGSKGTLVLKNDNPSGEPSRDKSVEVPIVFTN